MRTYINFDVKRLIGNLNSTTEFYNILEDKDYLCVTKVYKSKKGKPFSTTVPKQIRISPAVVGLIVGEGSIGERHFVFANSNEKAINEVLEFLKQFNLPMRFYLEISVKNRSRTFINKCVYFWKNRFKIKLDRIRLRKEFNSIVKYGTLHISVYNSLMAKLLKQIINLSKKKVENNKNFSIEYLKGILAAEGNINVKKKTSCVYMIRISASKQNERSHYKKCLEKINIKIYCKDMPTVQKEEAEKRGWKTIKGRGGAVIISKWDNFLKILLFNLFELHEEKREKFAKYFIYNQFTKQFLSFGSFIGKEFTMKDVQNKFHFSGRCLSRVLTMLNKEYIVRKPINKVKYSYKLTPKYIKTYNELKQELLPFLK
jgi:hypothetical protein